MSAKTDKKAQAALAALTTYVDAAAGLLAAWEKLGPFDVLTETCPPGFVEFGEQLNDLIEWKHRLADLLGLEPGCPDCSHALDPQIHGTTRCHGTFRAPKET